MFERIKLALVIAFAILHIFKLSTFSQPNLSMNSDKSKSGAVIGQVLDKTNKQPLIGTNIIILGTKRGGITDHNGKYRLTHLPPGTYVIEFSYIGYETERVAGLSIVADSTVHLDIELESRPLKLNEIIVTPGQFSVMGQQPTVRQTLTKQNLETIPFGEDVYRAIIRLPGVTSDDFSAKFTVRGGKNEEILVLLDGQELYEPFHLKDVDGGILSIIDVEAIEGIDLYTGGYPAQYGECMSGVFNMKSLSDNREQTRTSLGISLMNVRLMSEGRFHHNKGTWLVSARRGYLDLVLSLMGEKDAPQPIYYDLFGKVRYHLNPNHTISAHVLHSGDKLSFEEDDGDAVSTRYGNTYGWLTWQAILNNRLLTRTIASFGRISHRRQGIGYFDDVGGVEFTVADENWNNFYSLKQEWDFELFDRWHMRWGFNFQHETADYDYMSTLVQRNWLDQNNYFSETDSTSACLNPRGKRFGGYLTHRFQPAKPLTIEAGLRYDRIGYTEEGYFSPRLNAVYAVGKQTFLRAGWGYFYQSQHLHEIKVAYGETDLYPVQLSEHWVAGLEHTFHNGLNLRAEAYYKNISDPRPDYRTFSNSVELFPEIEEDLFALHFNRAQSKGLEFYLKYDRGGKISCWASYGLAYADEDVRTLTYEGVEHRMTDPVIPNRFDQRQTVYLDFNYRPTPKWHLNVSWQYHSGWPYTKKFLYSRSLADGSTEYETEYGKLYGDRFSAYQRMDLQLNRHFHLSHSRISLFLAVINLYNHDNLRNIKFNQHRDANGQLYLEAKKEYWFHLLPSLGVNWNWGY